MSVLSFDQPAAVAYFKHLAIYLRSKDDEAASQSDEFSQAMDHVTTTERSWPRGFVVDDNDLAAANRMAIMHGRRIGNMLFEFASSAEQVLDGDREFLLARYFPGLLCVGDCKGEKYNAEEVERNFVQAAGRAFVTAAKAAGVLVKA